MYSLGEALTTLSGFDLYIFGCKKETPTSLKEGRRFKKFSLLLSPAADRSRDLIYHRRSGLSSSTVWSRHRPPPRDNNAAFSVCAGGRPAAWASPGIIRGVYRCFPLSNLPHQNQHRRIWIASWPRRLSRPCALGACLGRTQRRTSSVIKATHPGASRSSYRKGAPGECGQERGC